MLMIMTLLAQAEARLAAGQGEAALALAVEALDEAESREQVGAGLACRRAGPAGQLGRR